MKKPNPTSLILSLALILSLSWNFYQYWRISNYEAEILEDKLQKYETELIFLKAVCDTTDTDTAAFCGPMPFQP